MLASGGNQTIIFPHCEVVTCMHTCAYSIYMAAAVLEAKLFISQGSHVLTSTLLITCREGESENQIREYEEGGGKI